MVDTVGKPYLFEIALEVLEVIAVAVTVIVGVDSLEHTADRKIVLVVLIPENVAAPDSGLGQIVD